MMPATRTLKRKQREKCARCKEQAPIGGAVCFDCLDKMAAEKQAIREQGLCLDCWKQPSIPGQQFCKHCRETRHTANRQRYQQRKQAGLCTNCGKAPQWHGRVTCAGCWGKKYGL